MESKPENNGRVNVLSAEEWFHVNTSTEAENSRQYCRRLRSPIATQMAPWLVVCENLLAGPLGMDQGEVISPLHKLCDPTLQRVVKICILLG